MSNNQDLLQYEVTPESLLKLKGDISQEIMIQCLINLVPKDKLETEFKKQIEEFLKNQVYKNKASQIVITKVVQAVENDLIEFIS